ncbi:hypothetical protein SKAU_G00318560 [Synaphobranchus kaupii]|uniref:Uncharacterized protein n=1 Tax=Synaphobranchus kaupii TaxID=118154 RepID=A0A9Q1ET67_SYNKA|nr:hypothetical protein SKAU_G00318560 [Synaphobranchus kaupii]
MHPIGQRSESCALASFSGRIPQVRMLKHDHRLEAKEQEDATRAGRDRSRRRSIRVMESDDDFYRLINSSFQLSIFITKLPLSAIFCCRRVSIRHLLHGLLCLLTPWIPARICQGFEVLRNPRRGEGLYISDTGPPRSQAPMVWAWGDTIGRRSIRVLNRFRPESHRGTLYHSQYVGQSEVDTAVSRSRETRD